jgi:hypothetical protein
MNTHEEVVRAKSNVTLDSYSKERDAKKKDVWPGSITDYRAGAGDANLCGGTLVSISANC